MTQMLDTSRAAASDVPRIAGIDPEQLPLPVKFDYHLMLTRSPIGCHQALVLVLHTDGTWGIHRQQSDSNPAEYGIETHCGEGSFRVLVSLDRLPYGFDSHVLCDYCWSQTDQAKVVDFIDAVGRFVDIHRNVA